MNAIKVVIYQSPNPNVPLNTPVIMTLDNKGYPTEVFKTYGNYGKGVFLDSIEDKIHTIFSVLPNSTEDTDRIYRRNSLPNKY